MHDAFEKCKCRSVPVALAVRGMPAHLNAAQDAEVRFVNYAGSDTVDNCMRRLLTNSKLWWHQEYLEMVQKSATGVLVETHLADLQAALAEDGPQTVQKHGRPDAEGQSVHSLAKKADLENQFCVSWPCIDIRYPAVPSD